MSDESAVNGVSADVEITPTDTDSDETTTQTVQKLMQKLQTLEQQKQQLVTDNESSAAKIKQLEDQIQSSESDKRALSSIAARAADLETEVSRLQHDLITSMSEGQESATELTELKRVVEELKKSESEKSEKIDAIEKERNLLLERLSEFEQSLKESESQIRGFEMRERDLKREKVKVEEEAKAKLNEKDEQIHNLIADIEKSNKEKEEFQTEKNELESRINHLQKEVESHNRINAVIKEREVENTNGIAVNGDKKVVNSKVDWPVIAAGAVALVVVVYFRHAKF